ncbi:MAG: isochorismatase [Chloroflexi bacterium]|nr:isochorismatase [Chloroflexota bacterium]
MELPIPSHFQVGQVGQVWRVPYEQRAVEAAEWARQYHLAPASADAFKICLVAVDVQNTFCIPGFELYVGGRSGTGAIDDNRRLCEFIYRNLGAITEIVPTMDTHQAIQIFHAIYLVNEQGEHPAPFTLVSADAVRCGVWKINPALAPLLGIRADQGQRLLEHYVQQLASAGKYDLTIWPYHALLGGIGHALVSAFEEAVFFHSVARVSQPDFHVKGDHPFTEHYSVLGPEVREGPDGQTLADKTDKFLRKLEQFDAVLIAGEAKSHCVAWTIADLLDDILVHDHRLAEKVYLLEDCTSPVVVPGVMDYTDQADAAFQRFADAGMRLVRSTDPLASWDGIRLDKRSL